jgi:hypothetical protein
LGACSSDDAFRRDGVHLFLLSKLNPGLGLLLITFVGAMNLLPFLGLFLFENRSYAVAGWFFVVPFGLALIFGGYSHFLGSGPDNVFQMTQGPWPLSFQITATLLAVLEILGCWLGVRMLEPFSKRHPAATGSNSKARA